MSLNSNNRLRSKFDPRWNDPYVVVRKLSPLTYCVLAQDSQSEIVVHANRMKQFVPRRKQIITPRLEYPVDANSSESNVSDHNKEIESNKRSNTYIQTPKTKTRKVTVADLQNDDFANKPKVVQDCAECPIKSPYGILKDNNNSSATTMKRGYLRYIWEKTAADSRECKYEILRKGSATLFDSSNKDLKYLRDNANELEFIIDKKTITICSFKKSFKAKGIPDTYICYRIRSEDTVQIPPKSNELNLNGYLLRNTESDLCLA